ncbi:MAG: ThiF family adenylyltransferase [Patescibacteria group bacterium]
MDKKITYQPILINEKGILKLKKEHPEITVVDELRLNAEQLFLLRNPRYRFDKNYQSAFESFFADLRGNPSADGFGNWFYFPWLNTLVKYLPEDLHFELRTGRNKYLISETEQKKFYNSTVVFLGLSVGSHAALVSAMTGGAKHMKLADPDNLSGDNLNRVRTGFQNVGLNKTVIVARQAYEINPYAKIEIYEKGLTAENAEQILTGSDIVVEEMDNVYWKLRIRELARERGIPVVMATDNGDGVIVDIERYDINRNLPILNGLAKGLTAEGLKNMPPKDLPKVAGKIAGANLTVPRMLESVAEVGISLYSWPQLGTAANMAGSVLANLIRRIVNKKENIKSGRYSVNPDVVFESDYKRLWFRRKVAFVKFIRKMMKR